MHLTTAEKLAGIERAMDRAKDAGAHFCCFAELAVSPRKREAALSAISAEAARLSLNVAPGAPAFSAEVEKFIAGR